MHTAPPAHRLIYHLKNKRQGGRMAKWPYQNTSVTITT